MTAYHNYYETRAQQGGDISERDRQGYDRGLRKKMAREVQGVFGGTHYIYPATSHYG
jgi:hypothetical protein